MTGQGSDPGGGTGAGAGPASENDSAHAVALRALHIAPHLNRWVVSRVSQDNLGGELSFRQLTALYVIREESGTFGHLARRLMVTPAVVTGIVDRLEKRGYVRRLGDTEDRRRVRLELTDLGRSVSISVEQALASEIACHLEDFTPDQIATLARGLDLLDRVLVSLDVPQPAARRDED